MEEGKPLNFSYEREGMSHGIMLEKERDLSAGISGLMSLGIDNVKGR